VRAYMFTLAYAITAHMAQSRQRKVWPVSLRRKFADGFRTFAYGQLYTALSRSRLPPPIYITEGGHDDFWQSVRLANPEIISFLEVTCPNVLRFPVRIPAVAIIEL